MPANRYLVLGWHGSPYYYIWDCWMECKVKLSDCLDMVYSADKSYADNCCEFLNSEINLYTEVIKEYCGEI